MSISSYNGARTDGEPLVASSRELDFDEEGALHPGLLGQPFNGGAVSSSMIYSTILGEGVLALSVTC